MSLANRFLALELEEEIVVPKPAAKPAPAPAPAASTTKENAKPSNAQDKKAPAQAQGKQQAKTTEQKSEQKGQKSDKPKGERPPRKEGEGSDKKSDKPKSDKPKGDRPPRKEGEGGDKPKGDRPPRKEGDRPPRKEGDRPPRQEGDRPPRQEGERPFRGRPRRQEGEGEQVPQEQEEQQHIDKDLPPRKRQFDRRGPHRKEGEKIEYHGKGNWGKPGSEANVDGKEEKPEAEGEEKPVEAATPAEGAASVAPVAPAEPEDKSITFAEYKKQLASQKKTISAAQPRAANEGVDSSAWKNTEQFVRQDESYFVPPEKSGKKKEAVKMSERKAEVIEISPKPLIEDKMQSRYSNRGGRGRGPKPKQEAPKLDDAKSFPSLGKA